MQSLRKAIHEIIVLAVWKLTQLVQKKMEAFLSLEKPYLSCIYGVKDLKQSIFFGVVSMGNAFDDCVSLGLYL